LSKENNHIVVFEHEAIRFDTGEKRISEEQYNALEKYYGNGVPFFKLIRNGVQFKEYVGVIQVGQTIIEVLPKADKGENNDTKWRNILTGMLAAIGNFEVKATSQSALKIKPNNILDLYFQMFVKEVEYLLHNGLIKKYRKKEGNVTALKGSLQFGKHIQQNLIHQERFYVRHSTYDVIHTMHFILYKTIKLLKQINTNMPLQSRIASLLLHFPEMPDIKVTAVTFEKLVFSRKKLAYKKSIEIAKLLLLQYHPDISKGRNNVLALMFDMNKLWEQFVYVSLQKHGEVGMTVSEQSTKYFWKSKTGSRSKMIADIVINIEEPNNCFVLDTKWKNLNGFNPSPEDLRQLYVYHEYYGAKKVALVYPGAGTEITENEGKYLHSLTEEELEKQCSVVLLTVNDSIKEWQESISKYFKEWYN
jgi:5-methylcytosine-specific restriction enzyme subunit McrC